MKNSDNSENQNTVDVQLKRSPESEYVPPDRHTRDFTSTGRPNKISTEMIQRIYNYVRMGMPKDKAAQLAGISEATYYNWMSTARGISEAREKALGKEDAQYIELPEIDKLYLELLEAVGLADAEFIREGLQEILKEGPPGYKWALARLFRKIFGDKIEVGIDTEPVQLLLELPNMITNDAEKEPKRITSNEHEN